MLLLLLLLTTTLPSISLSCFTQVSLFVVSSKFLRPTKEEQCETCHFVQERQRCLFADGGDSDHQAVTDDDNNGNDNDWKRQLLYDFCGDFDNYEQVVEDRKLGLFPKEGGGHEHIHCTLVPLTPTSRLAAFYFDGLPKAIFRFRYYQFEIMEESSSSLSKSNNINMKLYTLNPKLEQELRMTSDVTKWPQVFETFQLSTTHSDQDEDDEATTTTPLIQELSKCDIRWSRDMDPVQHKYALEYHSSSSSSDDDDNDNNSHSQQGFHAVMVYGQAVVESSTMSPGRKILIRDQLSLWANEFWIHDRGYDPDTGDFIYGNQRDVPYRLKRVSRIVVDNDANSNRQRRRRRRRQVTNPSLQWTLGPEWRSEEEYQERLALLLRHQETEIDS